MFGIYHRMRFWVDMTGTWYLSYSFSFLRKPRLLPAQVSCSWSDTDLFNRISVVIVFVWIVNN